MRTKHLEYFWELEVIRIIRKIIGDPIIKWERRFIYYSKPEEERKYDERWDEIYKIKKAAKKVRKDLIGNDKNSKLTYWSKRKLQYLQVNIIKI